MPAPAPLRGIGSMATRGLMQELVASYTRQSGVAVSFESVGGVDAARRVAAGEPFDLVVLASDAIDKLVAAGKLDAARKTDLVRSTVGVAVHANAAHIEIGTEDAVRRAVIGAARIAYSTGPSGVALMALFERWGITAALDGRLVQAPPGVPVGAMIARGEATLGFQQMSELMGFDGITLLGPLPSPIQVATVFCAAPGAQAAQPQAVHALIAFMACAASDGAKRRHGMEPA